MAASAPPSRSLLSIFLPLLLHLTTALVTAASASPKLLDDIAAVSNRSLLWGPYRPNLYFGVKPRVPGSFISGLMWSSVNDYSSFEKSIRHQCEQGDDMAGYGWEEYDIRTGGRQVFYDRTNGIDLSTEFVKVEGGEHGGNWGVRIKGTLRDDAKEDAKTTVIFYVGNEGTSGTIKLANTPDDKGLVGIVQFDGSLPVLGDFKLEVTTGPKSNRPPAMGNPSAWAERPLDRTMYSSSDISSELVWKAKDVLFLKLHQNVKDIQAKFEKDEYPPPWQTFLIKPEYGEGNLHMVQKVFEGSFQFDVLYSSASAPEPMTSKLLTKKIKENHQSFLSRFQRVFKLQPPFTSNEYTIFAQNMFSNLLGGVGHFHGTSIVDRSSADEYLEEEEDFSVDAQEAQKRLGAAHVEGPTELFTTIPSRPFFPRGFYWDEGFHLLPISDWDMDLTLTIFKSWFTLMDDDGWIGREQILGDEARSRVPAEFQTQFPHYANPPTLFGIPMKFIDMLEAQDGGGETPPDASIAPEDLPTIHLLRRDAALQYLRDIYPKLRKHYYWFRSTQSGDIRLWDRTAFSSKEGYRWRGRTPEHCLTSGLDDYPRAMPPHTGELHVDLLSWVGMMTQCMRRISSLINEPEDEESFARIEIAVRRNLVDLHWSKEEQAFCDASIDADTEESVLVCHKGYVSLLPALLGLVDYDSGMMTSVLDLMEDPEELWSQYGLRSLSRSDPAFGKGENYWKGPVWININYLAITRLRDVAEKQGTNSVQAARIYQKLRKAVVENVYRNWKQTGYAWEQYDDVSGKGQRTAHFLGWTSLVVRIMGMPEAVEGREVVVEEERVRDEL